MSLNFFPDQRRLVIHGNFQSQLRCRLEQVEGELELLAEERIALIEAIGRCEEGGGHDAVEAAKRQ
jgi:hypothetical protein